MLILGKSVFYDEGRFRFRICDSSNNILSDVAQTKPTPPTSWLHVVKHESSARLCFIAAYDTWRQVISGLCYVTQRNICHFNERLSWTVAKWIKQTSISVAVWLRLLLRSDVNTPPGWGINFYVFVGDVCNLSTWSGKHWSCSAWISLDIYSFEGMMQNWVLEGHIFDAVMCV